jgi:hypothetical protein
MTIDEELPQRVRQTIRATKSMLMVFSDPKEFAIVGILPQNKSFTALYFANTVILPLDNRHTQQLGDVGRCKLHLHFDISKCHIARHVQEQIASCRCVRVPQPPYLPDLAIADFYFYLFGRLKQQLSGRSLDSEENVLETITEILSDLPNDEVKSGFVHWNENASGSHTTMENSVRIS